MSTPYDSYQTPWFLRLLGWPPNRVWVVRYDAYGVSSSGWEYHH